MVFLLLCVWCLSPPPSSWTSSIFVSVTLEWCIARSRYSVNSCEVTTTQHGGRMAWVSAYAPKYRSRAVVWAQLSNHWPLKFHSSWWVFSLIALFKILYIKGNVLNICILLHLNFAQIKFIWDAMVLYSLIRDFQQTRPTQYGGSLLWWTGWHFSYMSPLFQKTCSKLPSDEACSLQCALWNQGKDR